MRVFGVFLHGSLGRQNCNECSSLILACTCLACTCCGAGCLRRHHTQVRQAVTELRSSAQRQLNCAVCVIKPVLHLMSTSHVGPLWCAVQGPPTAALLPSSSALLPSGVWRVQGRHIHEQGTREGVGSLVGCACMASRSTCIALCPECASALCELTIASGRTRREVGYKSQDKCVCCLQSHGEMHNSLEHSLWRVSSP